MKEAQEMVGDFLRDRPVIAANNTFDNVVTLLLGEVEELREAKAGGDQKDIAQEMSDVIFFALTLANILGVDAESELKEKIAYNLIRYQSRYFQGDMSYEDARDFCRKKVIDENIKQEFYSIDV